MPRPIKLLTNGRWSGGGAAVLRNLMDICDSRPDVLTTREVGDGGPVLVARNVAPPSLLRSRNYMLMPQNAWPWVLPSVRGGKLPTWAGLRMVSEASLRRTRGLIRIGPEIPTIAHGRQILIPNVLDEAFEHSLAQAERTVVPDWVRSCFVSIGSIGPYRNLDRLIAAYRAYRSRGGVRGLLIVGQPTSRPEVRRVLAASHHVAGLRVQLQGQHRVTILALMRAAAGVVLPSWIEASPLTPLEAAAVGAPLAISSIPGNVETLAQASVDPFYFDPFDVAAMCSALHELEKAPHWNHGAIGSVHGRDRLRVTWKGTVVEFLLAFQSDYGQEHPRK